MVDAEKRAFCWGSGIYRIAHTCRRMYQCFSFMADKNKCLLERKARVYPLCPLRIEFSRKETFMPLLDSEQTSFTLDSMGRFLCNTLQEATASSTLTPAGKGREFDVIIVGGGTFGAIVASTLFLNDPKHSRRILVLESGPFALPEHVQNMPYQGGVPSMRVPWDSHPALAYAGLLFSIGGRSLTWGGWSPELLDAELSDWPQPVVDALRSGYFREAAEQLAVVETNDFIHGRLHTALRRQLLDGLPQAPLAIPLASLPNHPAVRYYGQRPGGPGTPPVTSISMPPSAAAAPAPGPSDQELRQLLGLASTDSTPRAEMLNLMKLEAPLAVQAQTTPGLFPFNKFSAVPNLIRAARQAVAEANGVGPDPDARRRLMIVPKCRVLDIITETQNDNWVRATGVRVKNAQGGIEEVFLAPPRPDGRQGVVVIALGTIESTRLAQNTFRDSLAGRAAERMGRNLMAHLRSNLDIRIPVGSLTSLPPADQKALQTSALFVKGKKHVAGKDRFFHLQITASGLGKLGDQSEAELFKKIPDIEHVDSMLRADDTHVVITLRGIGEMTPQNTDSFVRLSPTSTEDGRALAEVSLADIRDGTSTTTQSQIDQQVWAAMDDLADQVALIFANGQPFEVLNTKMGKSVRLPANATVQDLKNAHPHPDRRDRLGTTHHDAGPLWMGANPATSVTNDFGRIHDTTNCYVASPALFPTVGSPNPMLTGTALVRRTADLLAASVLPAPALRALSAGFKSLFDGTAATFRRWKLAGRANVPQGFQLLDGELVSYGSTTDVALLYYAAEAFADFHLRLQFKILDPNNCNSGVFVRFRDPLSAMPAEIRNRAAAAGDAIADNPALSAIHSGFEIQIDDNARGDTRRDFYGRFPEPDGLFKNRTGAIYKIPAGDSIMHLGTTDVRLQDYVPGPALRPNVWFQYDVVVTASRYEVTLTDTESGQSQRTTLFNNPDAARGVAAITGAPAGFVGIQSYPNSRVVFRDVWIK
ncbi:MAG: family 16 glycoside hydrolase [Candidatus Acidiferrales bacterium]